MAAPKKANVGPAAEARRQIGLETAAVKLRAAGRETTTGPPTPTRHYHDGAHCWTPTLCAGREALDKLREFVTSKGDTEALMLVDQLAEYLGLPAPRMGDWQRRYITVKEDFKAESNRAWRMLRDPGHPGS
jgi:hypothetical protein